MEEQPDRERRWRLQPFASFRYRGYPWLWAANVTYGAVLGAQAFLVVWLIIDELDRDYPAVWFPLLVAFPLLLLALPAGWLADRRDRRLLLMGSHVGIALVLLITALIAAGGGLSFAVVVVLSLLLAAGMALGQPVRLALVPTLVPRERILNGNALNELGMGLGVAASIPLVGATWWELQSALVILIVAIVAAVGALLLLPLHIPPREPRTEREETVGSNASVPSWRSDTAEAFRFVWGTVELRMLFVLFLVAAVVGPWLALHFSEIKDQLDLTAWKLVLLSLFTGVGMLVSVIVMAFVRRIRRAGLWFGVTVVGSAAAAVGVWLSSSYGLTGFLMALFGLALGVRGVLVVTMVQAHTPIAVMGRVMGIFITLTAAAGMLAPLIARAGRALLQDEGWIVCSAIVLVGVVAVILWRNPGLRRMPSHPEAAKPVDEEVTVAPGTG